MSVTAHCNGMYGSESGEAVDSSPPVCHTMSNDKPLTMFQRCSAFISGVKQLALFLDCLTLMLEALHSFTTLVSIDYSAWHKNPEGLNLHVR